MANEEQQPAAAAESQPAATSESTETQSGLGQESGNETTDAGSGGEESGKTETTETKTVETKEPEKVDEPIVEPTAEEAEKAPVRVVPKAEDYKLPDSVPERVAQFAHDNDMTQEQLDNTFKEFGSYMKLARDGEKQTMINDGHSHVQKWGKEKEYNLSIVRRALKQNDPKGELRAVLDESGFGNHPVVLDFLLKIGNSMKEGGFLKGAVNTPKGKQSAAQTLFGANHPSN